MDLSKQILPLPGHKATKKQTPSPPFLWHLGPAPPGAHPDWLARCQYYVTMGRQTVGSEQADPSVAGTRSEQETNALSTILMAPRARAAGSPSSTPGSPAHGASGIHLGATAHFPPAGFRAEPGPPHPRPFIFRLTSPRPPALVSEPPSPSPPLGSWRTMAWLPPPSSPSPTLPARLWSSSALHLPPRWPCG